jgi:hypothetical protein
MDSPHCRQLGAAKITIQISKPVAGSAKVFGPCVLLATCCLSRCSFAVHFQRIEGSCVIRLVETLLRDFRAAGHGLKFMKLRE